MSTVARLKSGRKVVVTKSPGSTFTNADEKRIISLCKTLARQNDSSRQSRLNFKKLPQLERLQEYFTYRKGALYWRVKRPLVQPGYKAGTTANGYVQIYVDGVAYREHRLIWKLHKGRDPEAMLDHINGNRSDNRIENLREATPLENARNRKGPAQSNTGVRGVSYCQTTKRFLACVNLFNRTIHLGNYVELECATKARKCAEKHLYLLPEFQEAA